MSDKDFLLEACCLIDQLLQDGMAQKGLRRGKGQRGT